MKVAAIICEYNPFHNGHERQLVLTREALGEDTGIVCLMSGSYVQRGEPAMFDKMCRAQAALACGADLVLENPVTNVLRSAEGYAEGSVQVLHALGGIDFLSFGVEQGTTDQLMELAVLLDTPAFSQMLRPYLEKGMSFAAAREQAVAALGADARLLRSSNAILGIEYCKAICRLESTIVPLPIQRNGTYYAEQVDPFAPSATAIRKEIVRGGAWHQAVPTAAKRAYEGKAIHRRSNAEQAMQAVLRTLPRSAYEQLPHGSEGLWSRFYRSSRQQTDVESMAQAVKSKRYARSRIDRMILCAFLGISRETLSMPAPYVRILGFRPQARTLLRVMRDSGKIPLVNAGATPPDRSYFELEKRCADLYGFFSGCCDYGTLERERSIIFAGK